MHIQEYQMPNNTIQMSLPAGAKFLGARHGLDWGILFFLHAENWTSMERWDLVAVRPGDSPDGLMGGDISQYEFLCHLPGTPSRLDAFLFRKTQ